MELKFGRGTDKREKSKPEVASYKRSFDDDFDYRLLKQSMIAKTDKSPSPWKSADFAKKSNERSRRSVSPSDHRDIKRTPYSDDQYFMDEYKRSATMKKDFSPTQDDFDRLYSESFDSDSKKSEYDRHPMHSRSHEKSPYKMSPEYRRACAYSQEPVKKDAYLSKNTSNEYSPTDRSYQTQDDYLLPHEKITRKADPVSNTSALTNLVEQILALPTRVFLKIVASKMEGIELKGIEELDTLSKIINKSQAILCSKLPPDAIAIIKHKMSQKSKGSVQKNISRMELPMPPSSVESKNLVQSFGSNPLGRLSNSLDEQPSLNFITDILIGAESYNSTPATSEHLNSYQSASSQQTHSINSQETRSISSQETQCINSQETQSVHSQQTQSISQEQTLSINPQQTQSINPQQTQSINPQEAQSINPQETQNIYPQQTQNIYPYPTQSLNPHQHQTASLNPHQHQIASLNPIHHQIASLHQSQYPAYMNAHYPNTYVPYQSNNVSGYVPFYNDFQCNTTWGIPDPTLAQQTPGPQGFNYNSYTTPPPNNVSDFPVVRISEQLSTEVNLPKFKTKFAKEFEQNLERKRARQLPKRDNLVVIPCGKG